MGRSGRAGATICEAHGRGSLGPARRAYREHERALAICNALIGRSSFSLIGYEGAAIYYDRVAGDPARALEVVEHGLGRLADAKGNKRWRVLLQARRERMRQKAIQF